MKHLKIALAAFLVLAAASCSKERGNGATGSVNFSLSSDDNVSVVTKGLVSDYTSLPAAAAFSIAVSDTDGGYQWSGLVSDWDASEALPVGNYTVSASYGAEGVEGFDKPYFEGGTTFSIVGGETTQVSVPVALGNSLVKIVCSDQFKNYFTAYSFTVATGSGNDIVFSSEETRAAFVDAYKFTVNGNLTTQAGTVQTFSKEYVGLEAKTCYTLSFDINNVGGVSISISFNDTVQTVELEDVELND